MIETLADNIYCIKLPLPNTPLKSLNVTLIKGEERNLVIDTGLNHDDCFKVMTESLNALDIDLNKTDFLITHFHADHIGLLPRLLTKSSRFYFNHPETEILKSWNGWNKMLKSAEANGFPKEELQWALENHPGYKFNADWLPEVQLIGDGDIITAGRYSLQCITTPGHTLGHICLYEPENKIFISGDHVLGDISPNILGWEDNHLALADYFRSLDKVSSFSVSLVVPGHRRIFSDFTGRIKSLKLHHFQRLDEITGIINEQDCDAFETASLMQWDIRAKSWNDFPIAQKWFATGEALAHLQYLEQERKINRQFVDGKYVYCKV